MDYQGFEHTVQRLLNDCRNTIRGLMPEDPNQSLSQFDVGDDEEDFGTQDLGTQDFGTQDFGSTLPLHTEVDLDEFEGDNESQEVRRHEQGAKGESTQTP